MMNPKAPLYIQCLVLCALLLVSCAKGPPTGERGGTDSTGSEEAQPSRVVHGGAIEELGITPPDTPWEEMSAFERELYMVGKVNPVMAELFQNANAERYANFSCETCHGESMREVDFKMPAKDLFPLPDPESPAWAQLETSFPEVMRFMKEEVTPSMGTLLGIERYSCMHCHPGAD
ncbi:MAG: hypothetical protein GX614_12080 [Sandaracinaceae bacterium]|nr:hypothetical protein [Sandaracinaceae bacterium]